MKDKLEEMERDLDSLNEMLRRTGYGQGQIDAYAAVCEERDELLSALRECVAWFEDNCVDCYALDEAKAALKKAEGK